MLEVDPVPDNVYMYMLFYRTQAEILYIAKFLALIVATIDGWTNVSGLRQAVIYFQEPLLKFDFLYSDFVYNTKRGPILDSFIPVCAFGAYTL